MFQVAPKFEFEIQSAVQGHIQIEQKSQGQRQPGEVSFGNCIICL